MGVEFDGQSLILVLLAGLFTISLSEFLSWIFVYRHQSYKSLKSDIQKLNKKVQKKKSQFPSHSQSKGHEKKISTVEAQLKALNNQMSMKNFKSSLLIGALMIGVINYLGTVFKGIVVAKLPFEPISLFQGITHRNIEGTDFTDCSYLFIYVTSTFIFRTNLKKILGFEPPQSAGSSFFDVPKDKQ